MTLERIETGKEPRPGDVDSAIDFAYNRMLRFWREARKQAIIADRVISDAEEAFRLERRTSGTVKGSMDSLQSEDHAWIDRQMQIRKTSPAYKDAVDGQQMYDRWTMREAEVLQALAAYRDVRLKREQSINSLSQYESYPTDPGLRIPQQARR